MITRTQYAIGMLIVLCILFLIYGCEKKVDYNSLDKENVMAALENAGRSAEIKNLIVEDDIVEIEIVDRNANDASIESDEFHYLKELKGFEDIAYVEMTYYIEDKDEYGNETKDKKVAESEIEGNEMRLINYDELSPHLLHRFMIFTYMAPEMLK